ncbi:MAG: hypothetical protein F4X56_01150 [Gammaproteobacteria bacterium]|nr:hypothetical protein [Gammaproteobacteria bacterium]MYC24508.1 hypothetical protein [Gammaproteobacteria bacterium]
MISDSDNFLSCAISLRATTTYLNDDLNVRVKSIQNTSDVDSNTQALVFGHSMSMVILRALATEYVLKSMALNIHGRLLKTHDLFELYNELGKDPINFIEDHAKKQGIREVSEILKEYRTDFTDWRYNQQGVQTNILDISRALDVLISAAQNKIFKKQFCTIKS